MNFHEIIKLVLPLLSQNWGGLYFWFIEALKTDVGLAGYSSKYASLGYCKTLSKEYARYGITSNYLSLGLLILHSIKALVAKLKKTLLITQIQDL